VAYSSTGPSFVEPYPTEGLVLDLNKFTYTDVSVDDKTDFDNDAVLYSGRGVHTDGVNDIIDTGLAVPIEDTEAGDIWELRVLVRCPAGDPIYVYNWSDDSTTQTADNEWEDHSFNVSWSLVTFPLSLAINSVGLTLQEADWAYIRLYKNGSLYRRAYLNEYTDPTVDGLNGKPIIWDDGPHNDGITGQYVGCTAIVQEGIDVGLAPPQVLGMDFNRYSSIDPDVLDPDGDILVPESFTKGTDALGNQIRSPRGSKTHNADGSGYAQVADSDSLDVTTAATWVFRGNIYGTVSSNLGIISKYDFPATQRSWRIGKIAIGAASDFVLQLSADLLLFDTVNFSGALSDVAQVFAITYNAGQIKLWIDGVNVDSKTSSVTSIAVSSADVQILGNGPSVPTIVYDRAISDVKIYHRVLTDEEIQQLS